MKRLALLCLLLIVPAVAQNLRYDNIALGPKGPIPRASIAVCTQPANTASQPCSPLANLCSSMTDTTCTQPNPVTADLLGNFFFYVKRGQVPFTVQVYGPQVAAPYVMIDQGVSTNNVRVVDGNNSQGWPGPDFGAWVNAAIASLPTMPPVIGGSSYPSGTIYLYPSAAGNPTGIPVTTTITVNSPMVRLIGTGAGSLSLSCQMTSGDCIRWNTNPFNQQSGAELSGMSLTGNGTAASGIHVGDLTSLKLTDIYVKSFTSVAAQDGLGSAGAVGLWVDNVTGFSERWQLDRITLDGNIIQMKVTNSASGCNSFNTSFSYWAMGGQVNMRVTGAQIGVEIGPGASTGHGNYAFQINGNNAANKTYFQMDGTAGACTGGGGSSGAATMNNVNFSLMSEENGSGTDTLLSMASGTSLVPGQCFIHNFPIGGTFSNTLNGTFACQQYFGPTGNQMTGDFRYPTSHVEQYTLASDSSAIDSSFALTRNNAYTTPDDFFDDIGFAGDCFSTSVAGDLCIRNTNSGNVIALSIGAAQKLTVSANSVTSIPIIAGGVAAALTGTGACATITTQTGGVWAGSAKCTGTTGAATLTITPTGTSAPNGWVCYVQDETTRANLLQQTSHSTTACTLTATSVTQNDVFVFSAIAF